MAFSPLQIKQIYESGVHGTDRFEVYSYGFQNAKELTPRDIAVGGIYRAIFLCEFCESELSCVMKSRIDWAVSQGIPMDLQTAVNHVLADGMRGSRPIYLDRWEPRMDIYFDLWARKKIAPDTVKDVRLPDFDAWCAWLDAQIFNKKTGQAIQTSFGVASMPTVPVPPPTDEEVPF